MVPGKILIMGMEITKVDWAEPELEVDEAIMAKVSPSLPALKAQQLKQIINVQGESY
jgi:hypothetical protein